LQYSIQQTEDKTNNVILQPIASIEDVFLMDYFQPISVYDIWCYKVEDDDFETMRTIGDRLTTTEPLTSSVYRLYLPVDDISLLKYINKVGEKKIRALPTVECKYKQLWNDIVLRYFRDGIDGITKMLTSVEIVGKHQKSVKYRPHIDLDDNSSEFYTFWMALRTEVLCELHCRENAAPWYQKDMWARVISGDHIDGLSVIWGITDETYRKNMLKQQRIEDEKQAYKMKKKMRKEVVKAVTPYKKRNRYSSCDSSDSSSDSSSEEDCTTHRRSRRGCGH